VPLYTLGFPRNADLSGAQGNLSNKLAPGGKWQTTLPIEHGNSGSPIFDIGGRVVAIASGGIDDSRLITYAVPADYAAPLKLYSQTLGLQASINTDTPPRPAKTFSFPVDFTVGHEDSSEFTQEFCTPDGSKIRSWTSTLSSVNGRGSRIVLIEPVVGREQCIRARFYVAGNGVDRVAGIIVNYRGRGWLTGTIQATAE
jgi:hypothetical protein